MGFLFDLYALGAGITFMSILFYIISIAFFIFAIIGFITTIKFLFGKRRKSQRDKERDWLRTGKF